MLHTRMRWLIAAVALVVTLATTLLAGPALGSALAASGPPPPYLALGDSVAFGYSPQVDPRNANHFSGYPTPAARALKESLTNAACPGETSSHFIDLAGSDNGCGAFRANYPLHVAYSDTQLAFADSFLTSHPTTKLVSINIGANDLFVLENNCGGPTQVGCIISGLPTMLDKLATNLSTIYYHIRTLDHYQNQLVALTYYSLNYSPANSTANTIILALNNVVAQVTVAAGGKVANGFDAFAAIATAAFGFDSCAARLLIEVSSSPLTCNIHPSYPSDNGLESHANTGRDVLGQAIVNEVRTD
jgi:hypothetical protein